jgi:hypothetical protein
VFYVVNPFSPVSEGLGFYGILVFLCCESIFSIFLMHSEFIVVFAKEIWHASCEVFVAENDFVCSFPKSVMD